MEEKTVKTWEEFEGCLEEIRQFRNDREVKSKLPVSDLLFRGQADAEWVLETTLERFAPEKVSLENYYKIVFASKYRIESFTGKPWNVKSLEYYKNWLSEQDGLSFENFPSYKYMAYLRHYGFPSPLLDWTYSPYIASFFAFQKVGDEVPYVSIYVFLEFAGGGKRATTWNTNIHTLKEYVATHKRHFLQQCIYTICTEVRGNGLYYTSYEDVAKRNDNEQDILWKINIPKGERIKALKKLDSYNINSFSLFGSEESLMDMIATREFLIKQRHLQPQAE